MRKRNNCTSKKKIDKSMNEDSKKKDKSMNEDSRKKDKSMNEDSRNKMKKKIDIDLKRLRECILRLNIELNS
jgi:hypothetical protein